MFGYDEYIDRFSRLAHPNPLPDNMPITYAVMLDRPIGAVGKHSNVLSIQFVGGGTLCIWDDGQSCCESRYMTTDDELDTFVGAKVVGLEVVDGPDVPSDEDDYGDAHEQTFVKLETTMGTITMVTHNEHNGYYGGFNVTTKWED